MNNLAIERPGAEQLKAAKALADKQEAARIARVKRAAPDLLESEKRNLFALENLLAYLRKHEEALPPMSLASLEVRITLTRAAIAKAEGGAA